MHRLIRKCVFGLLAIAAGGCAHMNELAPCTGGCCQHRMGFFEGLLVPPCGQGAVSMCSDCGGDPCTCGAPMAFGEGCAAPVDGFESCAAPAPSCESCAAPAFSICRPNLLHALLGCTGCDDEFYWSEWFSDPPACHDPCDDCGNWTGYCDGCGTHAGETIVGPVEGIAGCPDCGKVH